MLIPAVLPPTSITVPEVILSAAAAAVGPCPWDLPRAISPGLLLTNYYIIYAVPMTDSRLYVGWPRFFLFLLSAENSAIKRFICLYEFTVGLIICFIICRIRSIGLFDAHYLRRFICIPICSNAASGI